MKTLEPLKTGLSFYLNNLWNVARRGWIFSVPFAVIFACLALLMFNKVLGPMMSVAHGVADTATLGEYVLYTAMALALIVVGGAVELLFYSRCVVMLRPAAEGTPKWKYLRKVFVRLVLTVVDCIIVLMPLAVIIGLACGYTLTAMQGEASTAMLAYVCLAVLVGLCLLIIIPLIELVAGSVFSDEYSFWKSLMRIRDTFRRYPLLLVTFFGFMFTVGLAASLVCLPLQVLFLAGLNASVSLLNGDAVQLPQALGYAVFGVALVTGFLLLHFRAAWLFVMSELEPKRQIKICH